MTFLRRYGFGAVGFNFFCSCLVMLEGVLVIGAVQQVRDQTGTQIICHKAANINLRFIAQELGIGLLDLEYGAGVEIGVGVGWVPEGL